MEEKGKKAPQQEGSKQVFLTTEQSAELDYEKGDDEG